MGFATEADTKAEEAAKASEGNGEFPPLPGGKYQVTIAKIKGVSAFAKSGPNAAKKVVDIGFVIVDESPTGKGRWVWDRVPLFSRFAPSEKYPDGAPAKAFWDFWGKAIGIPKEELIDIARTGKSLPDTIGGTRLTVTLSAPIPPDSFNPLGSNEVDFYDKAGDVAATPAGPVNAPWLDEHGNLRPEFGSAATAATVASTSSADPYAPAVAGGDPYAPKPDVWAPAAEAVYTGEVTH